MKVPRLALTVGEPAGIGPDICLKVASLPLQAEVVVVGLRTNCCNNAQSS